MLFEAMIDKRLTTHAATTGSNNAVLGLRALALLLP
jgi:hypothetical protein